MCAKARRQCTSYRPPRMVREPHHDTPSFLIKIGFYDKYFPTIGIRRPIPKALGETRKIGGV
jgi:hypothetical protein